MDKKSLTTAFIILSIFNLTLNLASASDKLISVSFSDVTIGRSLIDINLNNFKFNQIISKVKLNLSFPKQKVQWVRNKNQFLVPRARVLISIPRDTPDFIIHYGNNIVIPQEGENKNLVSQIYMNLFNPSSVKIFKGDKLQSQFTIIQNKISKIKKNKVDLTCAPYQLKIIGLENDYLSISCKLEKYGSYGEEKPRLIVMWSATNYRLLDNSDPPYTIYLHNNNPVNILVKDPSGKVKKLQIKAKIATRIHRIKTAIGFGPYGFQTRYENTESKYTLAPSFMLYSKIDLTKSSSLRAFDALVIQKSIFNNLGGYFAYELADALDGLIEFIPLIGGQVVSFKFNKNSPTNTELIYPQGFETVYKHAFDIPNLTLVFGMFFSTSSRIQYKNLWIRGGKKVFWELNYIDWGNETGHSTMYGLSVGIPFLSFL